MTLKPSHMKGEEGREKEGGGREEEEEDEGPQVLPATQGGFRSAHIPRLENLSKIV